MKNLYRIIPVMTIACIIMLSACGNDTERRNGQMSSDGKEQLNQDMDSVNRALNDSTESGGNARYGN